MAQHLAAYAERVIIAGDDDQAIYQWSGADVERFLELDVQETKVLSTSYRLPRQLYDYANQLSDRITKRFPKQWNPRGAGGLVKRIKKIEHAPLNRGEWLILCRNNCYIKEVCEYLARNMWSYWSKDHSLCDEDLLKDIRNWELLRAGGKITKYAALQIYERLRVGKEFKRGHKLLPNLRSVGAVDLNLLKKEGGLLRSEVWYKQFGRLSYNQVEYIRGVLRSGEKLGKPRIMVSTIHSVKGGEADNVLLLSDITPNTAKSMKLREDEEARVFYVGVTRARESLYVLDGNSEDKYPLPLK
jgi:DNA helicase-2/ATP-dependent DNA helicase PcrA